MKDNIAIKVKNVSKKYCKSLKRSMLYGICDIGRNMLGFSSNSGKLRKNEFWAVDNLSFELKKGETLGIIGANGAGKTTILKMLNGIFWPDKGKIYVKGKTGALIALGAGFHQMLTGRENVFINGAIMGLSKKEIDKKFEDIVEFADIGDFIDSPVKFYSSGMFARLGFSIAINIKPDILLVDEVLSVGDQSFQNKSLRKITELKEKSSSVVFVSHNIEHMRSICDKVILLDKGKMIFYGKTDEGVIKYQKLISEKKLSPEYQKKHKLKQIMHEYGKNIILQEHGIVDNRKRKVKKIGFGDDINLFFSFEVKKPVKELIFIVRILNQDSVVCIFDGSNDKEEASARKYSFTNLKSGMYRLIVGYKNPRLVPGTYYPGFAIRNPDTGETYEKIKQMSPFFIRGRVLRQRVIKTKAMWKLKRL